MDDSLPDDSNTGWHWGQAVVLFISALILVALVLHHGYLTPNKNVITVIPAPTADVVVKMQSFCRRTEHACNAGKYHVYPQKSGWLVTYAAWTVADNDCPSWVVPPGITGRYWNELLGPDFQDLNGQSMARFTSCHVELVLDTVDQYSAWYAP